MGVSERVNYQAVEKLFDLEIENLEESLRYYQARKNRYWVRALTIRILSVALFSMGTIAPLIFQIGVKELYSLDILPLGYLCLGASAVVLTIDRISLFTEHHVSKSILFVSLGLICQRIRLEKEATLAAITDESAAVDMLPSVADTVEAFASERATLIKQETESWAAARRNAQDSLANEVSEARETAQANLSTKRTKQANAKAREIPGGLELLIETPNGLNCGLEATVKYDGADIDPRTKEYETIPESVVFSNLSVGLAEISVKTNLGHEFEKLAEIKPGEVTKVDFALKS